VSFWQRQRRTWIRYWIYTLVIAPIGFVFNVATTAVATPTVILVHACFMALIAPNALALSHLLLEGVFRRTGLAVTIAAQVVGMTITLFLTAALVERFTGLTGLLAGPLIAACALVLSSLVIVTLFDAYRQREIDYLRMEQHATEARYQSLNDQLQPHFLFNTLNVLSEAVLEDPKAGSDGILALARLYQAIVDLAGEKTVELGVELALVRDYLKLVKLRFGDRLKVSMDVQQEETIRVPPLAVFNLVENAVKHGVAKVKGPGELSIVARTGSIRIESAPAAGDDGGRQGIGLANLRTRLELAFAGRAELLLTVASGRAIAELRTGDST